MRKSDAVEYFGNQSRVARALGYSHSTIAEWPEVVPLEPAFLLREITKRRKRTLPIDFSLYSKLPEELRQ